MRWFVAAMLGLAACGGGAPEPAQVPGIIQPSGSVVFTVNGTPISQGAIDAFTSGMPDGQVEELQASGRYHEFLKQLGIGVVLYERAVEAGVHSAPEINNRIAAQIQQVLASALIQQVADDAVTDEAVMAYYDDRQVQYARPSVQARHILTEDEPTAREAIAALANGEGFAELAAKYSKDPASASKGGDMGWFQTGGMVPEVSAAAFAAEGDEVLGPIKSRFGWHVVQVTDRRELTPVDEVRGQIEAELKNAAVESYIDELRDSQEIVWSEGFEPVNPVEESHEGHGHE